MLAVATVIVYSGGYIFLVFLSVCLGELSVTVLTQGSLVYLFNWCSLLLAATGLYYLAELVEEYTKLAKKVITYTTQGVLVLHFLVLVVDRLPLRCVAAGVAAHLCYLGQLQRYPFMQLWSPATAGSIGACLYCSVTSITAVCCCSYVACVKQLQSKTVSSCTCRLFHSQQYTLGASLLARLLAYLGVHLWFPVPDHVDCAVQSVPIGSCK